MHRDSILVEQKNTKNKRLRSSYLDNPSRYVIYNFHLGAKLTRLKRVDLQVAYFFSLWRSNLLSESKFGLLDQILDYRLCYYPLKHCFLPISHWITWIVSTIVCNPKCQFDSLHALLYSSHDCVHHQLYNWAQTNYNLLQIELRLNN